MTSNRVQRHTLLPVDPPWKSYAKPPATYQQSRVG
ncbi:Uncharacterised protein [Vibrio cholerae]|nr:Uncharacterised protein [Vibrio cholerae]